MEKRLFFVDWLRAFACVSILLCHLFGFSGIPHGTVAAQLLNIGVEIFVILSGFLFGIQGGVKPSAIIWYRKRFLRIIIPYEMFLIILFILSFLTKSDIAAEKWLKAITGLQGFDTVPGAGQTWYITLTLICYFFTPVILRFSEVWLKQTSIGKTVLVLALLLIPATSAYIVSDFVWNFIIPLSWYTLAVLVGKNWKTIKITRYTAVMAALLMIFLFGTRLIGRYLADGTLLYDRIIVGYEHFGASFCIGALFAWIFNNDVKPTRLISFINKNSFEIYLYHVMFITGPVCLLGMTRFIGIDFLMITAITFLVSAVMRWAAVMISKTLA